MKKVFIKSLITTMILAIFTTTFYQNSASASGTYVTVTTNTKEVVNSPIYLDGIADVKENAISTNALPPRKPANDPFWKWVSATVALFAGVTVATVFVENAINNGIDSACKKWGKKPGVKQACAIFQS
ncbi:hypothetical protein [Neobacillus sp. CF12]|uniref:hypothetical protein n=1 Tax=Neobacillus sp. CF12 TaxID=3055864 RepID=UPI0025A0F27C|nr:hypothetical protein [Neobacillus sp. CF12]MDM5329934.1 hypothetical protein [Neobacillus sp. CF12]